MPARGDRPAADTLARAQLGLAASARVIRDTAAVAGPQIAAAAASLAGRLRSGGRVLASGNGGSAAHARHFAAELAGRLHAERSGLPAMALGANASDLTAIANDYGFERAFARLVEDHGRPGDVAVAFSTSGSSKNVLAAVDEARERGLAGIGLTGSGKLAPAVDVAVVVPSDVTPRIQEAHTAVCHVLCECVDSSQFAIGATA